MHRFKTDSLAFQLYGAAQAVASVQKGTALPAALTQVFSNTQAAAPARGAIQDIAYRTMRQLGRVSALLSLLVKKRPEPALQALLCCALTLLDHDSHAREALYDDFTVVNQAVTAAAADKNTAHAKGLVNAVLRRFLRERDILLQQALNNPVTVWNYPAWWIDAVKTAYPQQWQVILEAGNQPPPLTLRVNQRQTTTSDYLRLLADHAMPAVQIGSQAVWLKQPVPVLQIPGFSQGMVSVQDAAAQLAAPLLDVQNGMRVLDACAAPGGKTGHLLESADVELIALDTDPLRLARVDDNLQRLGLHATLKTGDASQDNWWDGVLFDRILADVPCTASGIVRRHPDIRWLRRQQDAEQLTGLSARILDNLWAMLRPGGKLLIATCSLWPQESENQAAAFEIRHKTHRLAAPGQLLPSVSTHENHDGLFYALFQKPAI
jgi:16S rRNA (cytosine967-C5)-methyltransferase